MVGEGVRRRKNIHKEVESEDDFFGLSELSGC